MKKNALIRLFSLMALSFLFFSNGCASKERTDSSMGDTDGVFQDKGQGVCLDVNSGIMWQVERGGKFSSLQEAKQYAENLQLGGHDDWRLPTKTELNDLHFVFYWKKNGNCNLKHTGEYWILNEGKSSLGHWETYILCEPNFKYVKSLGTKGYVRAVRP